jgi:TorA maturation chaperone TorD
MRLGVVRQTGCPEPEDHAGALCEIMAIISGRESGTPFAMQAEFFEKHLAPWMVKFFQDLQTAASMNFYRLVGKFGENFLIVEEEYLHAAGDQFPINDGGLHHEQKTCEQPAGLS